jgi:ubiquinone biosynthesis protein Coq4
MSNANRSTAELQSVTGETVGVSRELLKEILREVVAESGASVAATHDVDIEDRHRQQRGKGRDRDAAQRFIEEVRQRPNKTRDVVNVNAAIRSLESAQKVLDFMNPEMEGKSRAWGRNPQSRKEALAVANSLVKEALGKLKVKAQSQLN